MRFSSEVQAILRDAQEYASGAEQTLTTGHILLGMLTSTSRAGRVLSELRVDVDKVLTGLSQVKRADRRLEESDELLSIIESHMVEAANRSASPLVSSLHLLLAVTREKTSVAYKVFVFLGIPPVQVRTLALGGINGPVPRAIERQQRPPRGDAFADEPARSVQTAELDPRPAATAQAQPAAAPSARARPAVTAQAQGASPFVDAPDATPASPDDPGGPWLLDAEQFPLLTGLGRNLTAEAARGQIDPVIGRDRTIEAVLDVLHKRRANNPCLVGEPGVGKTAIVEGLALAMLDVGKDEGQARLREKVVISIDVGSLVAGTELRGSFSRRMAKLKDEVRAAGGRVIVFIDELHTLVGAGSGEGALDAANDLKAALARGEFPCIGATTPQEYHRYIEKDPALERRFQPIEVEEPSEEDALAILRGVIDKYENHHNVLFRPEALEAAVRMSRRYLVDRRLPDKAFNLVDTAAARATRQGKEVVEVTDIAGVVSELTKIPSERLLMTDAERMLMLRDFLGERIIGQPAVLDAVADVIQRNSAGFSSKRPIGSFLFLGPSGVGKTETAKVLADFLFCSKDAMTRIDMSELMERHAVARLLGAAPGYVGHEDAGQLTAALARRPYQIVLFDEVEKAHPDVLNILLQVLDEGRLTDAKGRPLSFRNTVIIMTSNLGADAVRQRGKAIGFGRGDASAPLDAADEQKVLDAARKVLPPELWGRVDEKCVFGPLGRAELARVAELLVAESSAMLFAERGIRYQTTDAVIDWVLDKAGLDPSLGARPLRRAVQRHCENAVARAVLRGEAQTGDHLVVEVAPDGQLGVYVADLDAVADDEVGHEDLEAPTEG
ncbi:MAG: ATP-dependent Clp protease ATP-binding subunit [Deltaproteobacteria bacterium]|nr:ATP-dependent Clp protease ATP-binding subunit [Deltaproteobacteria bacterium]